MRSTVVAGWFLPAFESVCSGTVLARVRICLQRDGSCPRSSLSAAGRFLPAFESVCSGTVLAGVRFCLQRDGSCPRSSLSAAGWFLPAFESVCSGTVLARVRVCLQRDGSCPRSNLSAAGWFLPAFEYVSRFKIGFYALSGLVGKIHPTATILRELGDPLRSQLNATDSGGERQGSQIDSTL